MRGAGCIAVLLAVACAGTEARLGLAADPAFAFGNAFDRELAKPILMTRSKAELRPLLQRLSQSRGIAILLDRRIDPSLVLDVQLQHDSTRAGLESLANAAAAAAVVVGDTVFIGPREPTAALRTLVALRDAELHASEAQWKARVFELSRRSTWRWNDLEEPAALVRRTADRYKLQVEGIDQVPYDLWGAGAVVNADAAETLSALLVQFDLTFFWTGEATGIRLAPIPPTVTIARMHRPRSLTLEAAARLVTEKFPGRPTTARGREIVVMATVEEHEQIERLLGNRPSPHEQRAAPADLGPLRRRRFTLSIVRQPAIKVINTLEAQGVAVEYDDAALAAADIDLDEKISLDLSEATADEFFTELCRPLGLAYEINDRTLTLTPTK